MGTTFQQIAPDSNFTTRDRRRITLQYIKLCLVVRAPESDIENLLADAQISDGQTAQPEWQHGIDVQHPVRRIRLETEDRLQQREDRSGGPGLRHVGTEILDREVCRVPMKAGVELG